MERPIGWRKPLASDAMAPPTPPRASTWLGLLSLAAVSLSGLVILVFRLAEPAPMEGLLTAILVGALVLVPLSWLAALASLLADALARRKARRDPDRHHAPKVAGWIMALASLVLSLLVLVLPGLLPAGGGSRGRARDKAAATNLAEAMSGLEAAFTQARQDGIPPAERATRLEDWLATLGDRRNPWQSGGVAFRSTVLRSGTTPEEARQQAVVQATTLGEAVFVLTEPGPERWLAGAVLTKGLYQPPPGDPDTTAVPSASGRILLRSVVLAD